MVLRYRKGQGLKENMVLADEIIESYRKQRSGYGVGTGLLASALIQGMTANLSDFDSLKSQKSVFDEFFNRNNNYPYSEKYLEDMRNKGIDILRDSLNTFIHKARELNIGSEVGSMNEGLRTARQNAQQEKENSKNKKMIGD